MNRGVYFAILVALMLLLMACEGFGVIEDPTAATTPTPSPTAAPTATPVPTPTATRTPTPMDTYTPTPTPSPTAAPTPTPTPKPVSTKEPALNETQSPLPPDLSAAPIADGKGRLVLRIPDLPAQVTVRRIRDLFLVGVGTTDKDGCVSPEFIHTLRAAGLNYFLPLTSWAVIERSEGTYTGRPCPSPSWDFYRQLSRNGAVLNGHCTLFFYDQPWTIPKFAVGQPFDKQKKMIERFIKATIKAHPEIQIWDLNEPVAQNSLGWTLEQHYDIFVSASKWIHEADPKAKVMINMIPIPSRWSTFDYEPEKVMAELVARGLEADIIGMELYYWWAPPEQRDKNGYPTMEWVSEKIRLFTKYNLPVILSEVGIPGKVDGRELWDEQANWMEKLFRLAHDEPHVIGATWYFVRDDRFMPYAGLVNDDYSLRPVAKRILKLAEEWNPSVTYPLGGHSFVDLEPGEYDIIVGDSTLRVSISAGQVAALP